MKVECVLNKGKFVRLKIKESKDSKNFIYKNFENGSRYDITDEIYKKFSVYFQIIPESVKKNVLLTEPNDKDIADATLLEELEKEHNNKKKVKDKGKK